MRLELWCLTPLSTIYHNGVRVIVFNATFNNISVMSWQSVLLVEETGIPGEKKVALNTITLTAL
jgi:hypothetical protein